MRGRRNPDRPQGNELLPPCRVCGERGSGFHYGVTTCGACKGFFRRSLIRSEPYVCMNSHLCKVGPSTSRRQSCPKCRYDKCISVGMSKDACKVGRYSLVKKSKDIAEMLRSQIEGSSDEGFLSDHATLSHSSSLVKLSSSSSSNSRDHDQNSTGTMSSSPRSPDYSDVPFAHAQFKKSSPEAESIDCDTKPMIPSSFCLRPDNDHFRDSYSDISRYRNEEGIYSDMESNDTYPYANNETTLNDKFYTKIETYSPANQMLSPSSFMHVSTSMMDSFTPQVLESPPFDPLMSGSPDSNYTQLESTMNAPEYKSPPMASTVLHSTPLLHVPNAINSSDPMLSTQKSSFKHSNITSTFTPTTKCQMNTVSLPQHSTHHFPMEETHTSNPSFISPFSTSFGNMTPHSSPAPSYNHKSVTSASKHPQTETLCSYSTPAPINPTREYSIDELIAQSINTDRWDDISWSNNFDQTHNQESLCTRKCAEDKSSCSAQTTSSAWSGCLKKHSSRTGQPIHFISAAVTTPSLTKTTIDDSTLPRMSHGNHFNSLKGDDAIDMSLLNSMETGALQQCDTKVRAEPCVENQCRGIVRRDSKQRQDEDEGHPTTPTTETPSSFFLLFICPELAPYGLSLFEKFPFVSYEQKCLYSVLNSCIDPGETFKSSLLIEPPKSDNLKISSVVDNIPSLKEVSDSSLDILLQGESRYQISFNDQDLERTLSRLVEVHDNTVGIEMDYMTENDIQTAQDVYMGLCNLRDRIHGPMQFIDQDVYTTILHSTGVDVDKRREFVSLYFSIFNQNLPKAIRFFRSVPGFQLLSMADRITMTKASFSEYHLLSCYKTCDSSRGILISPEWMVAVRMSLFEKVFPDTAAMHDHVDNLNARLKAINLTKEEIVVLKAICLTRPHRKEQLQDPMLAERLHQKFHSCLMMYTINNYPNPEERYGEITNALKEVYFVGSLFQKLTKNSKDHCLMLLDKTPVQLCTEVVYSTDYDDTVENQKAISQMSLEQSQESMSLGIQGKLL